MKPLKNKSNKKIQLRPWVKKRFYDNVGSNWGYGDMSQAIEQFVKNKKQIKQTSGIEADTQLAMYLGIPLSQRHFKNAQFKESKYKPSNYDKNKKYYSLGYLDDDEKEELINSVRGFRKSNIDDGYVYDTTNIVGSDGQELYNGKQLNFGESKTSKILSSHNLGTHTISRGVDPKRGEYVSYYDSWDINPFKGYWGERNNNFITKILGFDKKENIDVLGTPVNFYDRVYLDDFYNVRQTPERSVYYGGYLPNVTVTPINKNL